MQAKIYTIGETVFDIIFRNNQPIAAHPGGSMLNAAVSLGRLGRPVFYISELSQDPIGNIMKKFLDENEIQSEFILYQNKKQSRIALAFLNAEQNADYLFYQGDSSHSKAFPIPPFHAGDLILFGSLFALEPINHNRLLPLLQAAERAGCLLVYDPNIRKHYSQRSSLLLPALENHITRAHLIRGSHEDFQTLFGVDSPEGAWQKVHQLGAHTLIYTHSKQGVWLFGHRFKKQYSVPHIQAVSTIGAGDTFNAGLLCGLHRAGVNRNNIERLSASQWDRIIHLAIEMATHVCLSTENALQHTFAKQLKSRLLPK